MKVGKPKLFSWLAFLWVPLILVGINWLNAQVKTVRKGPKPRQGLSWTVHIPGEYETDSNLYGFFPSKYNIYDDTGEEGDGILIDVLTSQGQVPGETTLRLAVGNNIDESGNCIGWADGFGPRKIGFKEIEVGPGDFWDEDTIDEEYPCFFPTYSYPGCGDPDYGKPGRPGCMADFLNGLHPYDGGGNGNCTHPECCYFIVEIKVEFNRLIEDIVGGEVVSGIVWISLINTSDLQSGCEYPHNVEGYCAFETPGESLNITKKIGENTWTVAVDGTFIFAESYRGMKEGKGKGGKGTWEYKTPYWAKIPMTFVMDWTRVE